jgi:ribosome-associated translation inhibitor RaiA
MTYPVTVRFQAMAASPALEQALREKAAKLGQFHPAVLSCTITVEPVGLHQHQGRDYNVRLELHLKGKDVAITKAVAEDPYVAAREAFDAARRALDAEIDVRRGA